MQSLTLETATSIRTELHAAEDSTDLLLAQFGRLTTALSMARVEAGLPARMGQQTMTLLTQAMVGVVAAREQILQAHKACARQGKVMLPELGWGDEGDCPPVTPPSGSMAEVVQLHAVG